MHELTEKCYQRYSLLPNLNEKKKDDEIIRQWLTEKAVQIFKNYDNRFVDGVKVLEEILCLKEKELWEKLKEAFPAHHPHDDVFKHLATTAEQHFEDINDKS